jgi:aromatic-L-amino-acid/L-tryptophan decarboxylase
MLSCDRRPEQRGPLADCSDWGGGVSTVTPGPEAGIELEPSAEQLRSLLTAAVDHVLGFLDRLPEAALSDTAGVAAVLADEAVRRPPPASGRPLAELLAVLDRAAGTGLNTASPGFLAFVPGSGLVSAAVADLLAGVLNRYTGVAFLAPGLVALEADVLRWVSGLFGLPSRSAGLVTTGASMATLSAIVTARSVMLPENFLAGTLYVTEQAHHSVTKAALLAGLPSRAVRVVPVDAALRLNPEALRAAVADDRAVGRQPFCVVATAGTTNTGVVDPLPAIADIAREEGLWLHIDAAYGGFFQLTERGRRRLRGIERADSLALDAHKGLFLPFGTGILLVRDGDLLRRAHTRGPAHYMQDIQASNLPDFAEYGPELTRAFRGLRLWLPLHLHGVDAFRAALDDKLDLAARAYQRLSADPLFEVLAAPELSTVAFRLRHGDTAELLRRVNAEQRVFLASTSINGRYTGRICVLNHRTNRARVDEAIGALRRHGAELSSGS